MVARCLRKVMHTLLQLPWQDFWVELQFLAEKVNHISWRSPAYKGFDPRIFCVLEMASEPPPLENEEEKEDWVDQNTPDWQTVKAFSAVLEHLSDSKRSWPVRVQVNHFPTRKAWKHCVFLKKPFWCHRTTGGNCEGNGVFTAFLEKRETVGRGKNASE